MTVTEADIRAALQRAVDQADLVLEPDPMERTAHELPPSAERWPRVLAVAAAVLAAVAVAAVVRSGSERVHTGPTTEATAPTSADTTGAATEGTTPPDPSSLTVLVLNGSGTSGYAGRLTDQLADIGYQVLPAGNARDAVDPTLVYFRDGSEIAAQDLARRISRTPTPMPPRPLPVRPLGLDPAGNADLVVVLGRDWADGPLTAPAPGQTYSTTRTAPPSTTGPEFVLWAGTPTDAAQRATPEGTLRALMAAVDPDITVDDVTVTVGRHSGWRTVTARIGGTVYVEASTAPSNGEWVISGLEDVDHPDTNAAGGLWPDGRLLLAFPTGTASAVVYDLDIDPVRPDQFPDPGASAPLDQLTDQPAVGFEFFGPPDRPVANHLVVGRGPTGAVTTVRAFKIGP